MDTGSGIMTIATSRNGKWIVSGTESGQVAVWNATSHKKATEFTGHPAHWVYAVDISPDATKIATGSDDGTARVWSLSTGRRILNPLQHGSTVVTVKFSPDGRLFATATLSPAHSVRIYDSQDGRLLANFPIRVNSSNNQSLAWASDSKQLFALSHDGNIKCLNVSTGTAVLQWPVHSNNHLRCISLAGNGRFIAASANSSVSFWDTTSSKQIGTVIKCTADVVSMAISPNYDLVTGGGRAITLRSLCDVLPSHYYDVVSAIAFNICCVVWPFKHKPLDCCRPEKSRAQRLKRLTSRRPVIISRTRARVRILDPDTCFLFSDIHAHQTKK